MKTSVCETGIGSNLLCLQCPQHTGQSVRPGSMPEVEHARGSLTQSGCRRIRDMGQPDQSGEIFRKPASAGGQEKGQRKRVGAFWGLSSDDRLESVKPISVCRAGPAMQPGQKSHQKIISRRRQTIPQAEEVAGVPLQIRRKSGGNSQ